MPLTGERVWIVSVRGGKLMHIGLFKIALDTHCVTHTRWYFQLHFSVWVHWIYIEYIIQHIGLFKIASFVRGFREVTLKTDSRKGAGPIFHTVDKTQYKRVSCPESQQIISQRYWFSSWSMHVLLIQKLKSISTKSALQLSERSNHFKSTVKSTGTCSQR